MNGSAISVAVVVWSVLFVSSAAAQTELTLWYRGRAMRKNAG